MAVKCPDYLMPLPESDFGIGYAKHGVQRAKQRKQPSKIKKPKSRGCNDRG